MNIFSKWFGSKEVEEQKEEKTEEVCFKDVEQDEIIPNPQNLPEAFRYVVRKWGADYLQNRSLINILNDFQVLKNLPAAKHALLNMQSNGYIEKIIQASNWKIESKSISTKFSNEFGTKEDIVTYIVECIGYGLKLSTDVPQYNENSESSNSVFADPQKQTTNFIPKQNYQQPANNTPPATPQPVPLGPYDPKLDLEFYQYPTLDLLNDYASDPDILSLKDILGTNEFQNTAMDLPCAIGKKDNGELLIFDLAEAPHLMVSGASGMGVTVFFNTIITSLLYKKHPAEMKLILMDPKKIEFSLYDPLKYHFLAGLPDGDPVITDMGKMSETILSLSKLMEKRLELFKDAGVRNIKDYNKKFCARRINPVKGHGYMPYIIVLIDEYDVVSNYVRAIETPLENISRIGRSVGIHLIISVQRPVGTVISAGIKANISSRIAFRVTSVNESRNILGMRGAERLQRPGEMIYTNGIDLIKSKCAFIDTEEIDRINDFIGNQQSYRMVYELPDLNQPEPDPWTYDVDLKHLDPLFEDAARIVVINQSGSTSLIQRKFAIGYNRAGRLMAQMEKAGVVGPAMGSAPREVLIQNEYSLNKILASLR